MIVDWIGQRTISMMLKQLLSKVHNPALAHAKENYRLLSDKFIKTHYKAKERYNLKMLSINPTRIQIENISFVNIDGERFGWLTEEDYGSLQILLREKVESFHVENDKNYEKGRFTIELAGIRESTKKDKENMWMEEIERCFRKSRLKVPEEWWLKRL